MEPLPKSIGRVRGLDSIRFVCALWVFFGHGAEPQLANPFATGSFANIAFRGFYNNLWSGAAAVIVFFVISGFCIHFPFAGSERQPRLIQYYTRRFLRLLIPIGIAIPLSGLVGVRLTLFEDSILWSLLAELIYYLCYPIFRTGQLRFGSWRVIVALSFAAAFAVAARHPSAGNYPSYGPGLNWVLGLPCWLLGCVVAESFRTGKLHQVSAISVWTWRATTFGVACACSIIRFHSPIGYPWTLNFFAVLVAVWLHREITFRQRAAPSRIFEWAGSWSYSLYLIHIPAGALFLMLFPPNLGAPFRWAFMVIFVFIACYIFYLIIERPSHAIARKVAQKLWPYRDPILSPNAA
jgi:peptidoglycan/LPS O-acetylase OafA/YrhL